MTPKAEALLAAFTDTFADTGATKAELRAVSGQQPATFLRSVNALVRTNGLVNTGTDARPFYKLGRQHAQP